MTDADKSTTPRLCECTERCLRTFQLTKEEIKEKDENEYILISVECKSPQGSFEASRNGFRTEKGYKFYFY